MLPDPNALNRETLRSSWGQNLSECPELVAMLDRSLVLPEGVVGSACFSVSTAAGITIPIVAASEHAVAEYFMFGANHSIGRVSLQVEPEGGSRSPDSSGQALLLRCTEVCRHRDESFMRDLKLADLAIRIHDLFSPGGNWPMGLDSAFNAQDHTPAGMPLVGETASRYSSQLGLYVMIPNSKSGPTQDVMELAKEANRCEVHFEIHDDRNYGCSETKVNEEPPREYVRASVSWLAADGAKGRIGAINRLLRFANESLVSFIPNRLANPYSLGPRVPEGRIIRNDS